MAKSSAGESALRRALKILDTFSFDAPFLTLSEMARRAGYPTSTTHRIVNELVRNGLLEQLEGRRYRLGNRLWELGARTPGALGLREIARPYMLDLHHRLGQHVQLVVPYGAEGLVLERMSAIDAVVNAQVIGGHMPLQFTAVGLVLLAFDFHDLVEQVVEAGLRPPSSVALQNANDLYAKLDEIRRDGYASAEGYIYPASRGIAVPIVGSEGVVVAALGVVVPNNGTAARPIVTALRETAKLISTSLLRSYLPPSHPSALPGGDLRFLVSSSMQSMKFLERRRSRLPSAPEHRTD